MSFHRVETPARVLRPLAALPLLSPGYASVSGLVQGWRRWRTDRPAMKTLFIAKTADEFSKAPRMGAPLRSIGIPTNCGLGCQVRRIAVRLPPGRLRFVTDKILGMSAHQCRQHFAPESVFLCYRAESSNLQPAAITGAAPGHRYEQPARPFAHSERIDNQAMPRDCGKPDRFPCGFSKTLPLDDRDAQ